jgi:Ca2+-binding RTX toxin-like protein
VADIIGTPGDDEWHWKAGEANPELNLNPRVAGDRDSDVMVVTTEDAAGALVANGADGDDTIIGAPGARVRGSVVAYGDAGDDRLSTPALTDLVEYGAELHGGAGNDTVTGGGHEDELAGDGGDDRVDGRGAADTISGGRGRDQLLGGSGADTIRANDDARDAVSCGSADDRATVDGLDRLRECEQVTTR